MEQDKPQYPGGISFARIVVLTECHMLTGAVVCRVLDDGRKVRYLVKTGEVIDS